MRASVMECGGPPPLFLKGSFILFHPAVNPED